MTNSTAFIGRERELAALTRSLNTSQPGLIVVYGRRRVGKSTLLRRALQCVDAAYYQATRVSDLDNLELFKQAVMVVTGEDPTLSSVKSWEGVLHYLAQRATLRPRGLIVALDEFPYLCEGNPALPSILQKIWDEVREGGIPLTLVLCGSRISFMETLLAERNPLHGRQSAEFIIQPLSYRDAARFAPRWSVEDRLRLYAVFGGMPYYLSLIDPKATLATNIQRLLIEDGAPLREEPIHLLQAELNQIARYASILRAIADGCTQLKDIAGRVLATNESSSSLSPYIATLQGLRLVRTVASLDSRNGTRQRNARYYLDDPFLAFYYHLILPNLSAIQAGHGKAVYRHAVAPQLDQYVSGWFEAICQQWVRYYGSERLQSVAQEVGKIWSADYDVDVAAKLLDGRRLAGECKWRHEATNAAVLQKLRAAAAANSFYADDPASTLLLIFSRSPATAELRRLAAKDRKVLLLTPADLIGTQRRARSRREDHEQRGRSVD